MSINRLYHTWLQRIRQLRPHERITRLRNFAWLVTGIYQSRSVHLSKIAEGAPAIGRTQLPHRRTKGRQFSHPYIIPVAIGGNTGM